MSENGDHRAQSEHTGEDGLRLDAVEARVLGCLIEKSATTPDAYPLTLNATVTACNQKSNREPVMKLEPGRVGQALRELERKGLARHHYSSRAERYTHTAAKGLDLTAQQVALIALLLLRGPQTVNELLTRSERIHRFDDADEVRFVLERLASREPPLTVQLPRQSGQREDRFMHLLCGPVEAAPTPRRPEREQAQSSSEDLSARIEALEKRIARLEDLLD